MVSRGDHLCGLYSTYYCSFLMYTFNFYWSLFFTYGFIFY